MEQILSSPDFWKLFLPLSGAVVAWFLNEWRKRVWEQYTRKEEQYRKLIKCLMGFYIGGNSQLIGEFIYQLNNSWLYCPDEIIKKAYAFIDTVHAKTPQTDEVKENAMGELVLALRKDLLSRKLVKKTSLNPNDFRNLTINRQ